MVGVLIASRVAPRAGHIGQISVHPAYQDQGLGRRMLNNALEEFDRYGFGSVSLAVTVTNEPALHLYESCGFRTIHTFPVFCRETITTVPRAGSERVGSSLDPLATARGTVAAAFLILQYDGYLERV